MEVLKMHLLMRKKMEMEIRSLLGSISWYKEQTDQWLATSYALNIVLKTKRFGIYMEPEDTLKARFIEDLGGVQVDSDGSIQRLQFGQLWLQKSSCCMPLHCSLTCHKHWGRNHCNPDHLSDTSKKYISF